ncbi:MAG: pantoate kinase [Methanobrevibacter sp.]|uniref:pantoate kinase n=1 Tax=Methanobrevibacter sp. TaxID=66852 RepID=UPI0026E067DA|nr:pantoate kinase [Methanobrevibacter sp.]MDO5849505.1 pantoate kinase [Methanobrevibacter sp.]
MSVSVFVPGHITGFFNIVNDDNPLKNGSCGCGFLLNKGVTTSIKLANGDETSIIINGKTDLRNETIVREVLKIMDIDVALNITQEINLPIGAGFGTSASSALGIAIGLSKLLDLGNSLEKSGQIAHIAEINLGSGLGDVIAELGQGIVLRTEPGAPGIGKITSFNENDLYVASKTFSQIETSSIIRDDNYKRKISDYGLKAKENFLKEQTVENFLKQSYSFSYNTKLMSDDVFGLVSRLNDDENILGSSMAMLGNTVFAFAEDKSAFDHLDDLGLDICKINNEGIIHD